MNSEYFYTSVLGIHIQNFVKEKQAQGYRYQAQAYLMKNFDVYWTEHMYAFIGLTPESLDDWTKKRDCENKEYLHNRISVVREFSRYLNGLGINSYIPHLNIRRSKPLVHVLCDEEIADLFNKIDSYTPIKKNRLQIRMSYEYPILFRLIYCCGLRRSEACGLSVAQVDLSQGIITIYNAKGNKDRLIYLSEDMNQLCKEYLDMMLQNYSLELKWLFPGLDMAKSIAAESAGRVFNSFWAKTCFAATTDKNPTVHSLRHTYVVKRVNLWMKQGLDMNIMMPYLSKHLGHKSIDGTNYYYHYVQETAQIIREKDTLAKKVIPEVRPR